MNAKILSPESGKARVTREKELKMVPQGDQEGRDPRDPHPTDERRNRYASPSVCRIATDRIFASASERRRTMEYEDSPDREHAIEQAREDARYDDDPMTAATDELLESLDALYPLPDDSRRAERAGRTAAEVKRWMAAAHADIAAAIPAMIAKSRSVPAGATPSGEGVTASAHPLSSSSIGASEVEAALAVPPEDDEIDEPACVACEIYAVTHDTYGREHTCKPEEGAEGAVPASSPQQDKEKTDAR